MLFTYMHILTKVYVYISCNVMFCFDLLSMVISHLADLHIANFNYTVR